MLNDHFVPDKSQNMIQNLRFYENYLQALVKKYPTKSLPKPKLPVNHTHEELQVYSEKFELYTRSQKATEKTEAKYEELSVEAEQTLFEFMKVTCDFYNRVPVQYQAQTWKKANMEKEYYDKYVELSLLCDIFLPE